MFETIVLVVVLLAAWLLPIYLERRVAEAARGAVDERVGKSLADHTQRLEHQTEVLRQSLAISRERYTQDYSLFAAKRNEIYAELYALLEKAAGGYGAHFAGITVRQDYSRSGEPVLRGLLDSLQAISGDEKAALNGALDRGAIDDARKLANELWMKSSVREAYRAFVTFKNEFIVQSLYVSPAVEAQAQRAIGHLAALSTYGDELVAGETVPYQAARTEYMNLKQLLIEIRSSMRSEMTEGFRGGSDGDQGPRAAT
jgi:hypothetical protein